MNDRCEIAECRRKSACQIKLKTNPVIDVCLCNDCLQKLYFSLGKIILPRLKEKLEQKIEKKVIKEGEK